jgi:hypothetical protein
LSKERKHYITKLEEQKQVQTIMPIKTYASAVKTPSHVLVVGRTQTDPDNQSRLTRQTAAKTQQELWKGIPEQERTFIPEKSRLSGHNIVLEYKTAEDRDKAKVQLEKAAAPMGLTCTVGREKQPKVRVDHLPADITFEELKVELSRHLENADTSNIKVVNVLKRDDECTYFLKLSQVLHEKLIRRKSIVVNFMSCPISDYHEQCFKCGKFNHISKYCQSKACCGKCSSVDHETKACPVTDQNYFKCSNCTFHGCADINNPHGAFQIRKCPIATGSRTPRTTISSSQGYGRVFLNSSKNRPRTSGMQTR